jgi:hypothetical protein
MANKHAKAMPRQGAMDFALMRMWAISGGQPTTRLHFRGHLQYPYQRLEANIERGRKTLIVSLLTGLAALVGAGVNWMISL